jgi:hypothetical protein
MMSVVIDSGKDQPPHHARPLLMILGERPDPE